jgi:hypothetical protein
MKWLFIIIGITVVYRFRNYGLGKIKSEGIDGEYKNSTEALIKTYKKVQKEEPDSEIDIKRLYDKKEEYWIIKTFKYIFVGLNDKS